MSADPMPVNPIATLLPEERTSVPALLACRAHRSPDLTFLLWEGERWSYRESWEEIGRFAAWVRSQLGGRAEGARIAGFLPNRPEALWAWLGTLTAGATYVPLNRAHRGEILADMVARSGAELLVTDLGGLPDLPDLRRSHVRALLVAGLDGAAQAVQSPAQQVGWEEVRAQHPAEPAEPLPGDLAELMYTSGTTGRSKAVRLSHRQLCRGAGWVVWSLRMGEGDVFHAWLPLFHIAGQVDSVLPTAIAGGAVALYPTFSRSRFWQQVEESGSTLFIGFANVAQLLHSLPERDDDAGSSLRAGITGAMPARLSVEFESRFGVRLHDVYGMTEAEPMILPPPGAETPPGSCGRPNPDFEVAILAPDGSHLPAGEVGEIACRPLLPDVLTGGYEGDAEATVEATADLWFHTGDLGRRDERGFVYFVDRIKHSIRRRGENVSSWELENVLVGHPDVAECCAIGVPSPLGEEDVKVAVVAEAGAALEPESLWAWCREQMAAFMVPRYIEVVRALPRADTGKVMKERLRVAGPECWDAGEGGAGSSPPAQPEGASGAG